MIKWVIRTLKEQCAHRQQFETLQYASRVIGDWSQFYNQKRPYQALKMKTPAQAMPRSLSCAETTRSLQIHKAIFFSSMDQILPWLSNRNYILSWRFGEKGQVKRSKSKYDIDYFLGGGNIMTFCINIEWISKKLKRYLSED